jgi:50S ribosome-binding GTPase
MGSTPRHPQSNEDVVIVVMGMTGSGKSTLINLVADEKVKVGHSLHSCTTEVQVASFITTSGRTGYLIDTPGFDDTNRSDTEILKEIAGFLTKLYTRNIGVTGLVYVHRITEPRLQGSAITNLEVFQKLCGVQCFPQVALVSTMWQELRGAEALALGKEREAELQSNVAFWGAMTKGGSRTFRHSGEIESAEAIFRWFFGFPQIVLNVQRELVDDHLTLDQTEAGKFLKETAAKVKEKYENEIRQLRTAIGDAHKESDLQTENELLLQRNEVEAALEKVGQNSRNMLVDVKQLEAEKNSEYAVRVEELERKRELSIKAENTALLAKLKEVQEEMDWQRFDSKQREKELCLQADAIRRQDNGKAREQIVRLEAELSRVQAESRNKTKVLEDVAERLEAEAESSSLYGASRVLDFLMRTFAPAVRSRHGSRTLSELEGPTVKPPRRSGAGDSM